MFPVVINDGQTEMPKDDVFYIIGKEGIFLKKTIGVMDSLAPVSQISTLQSVAASAQMRITKIPGPKFAKVIEFFRAVYDEYYGEAIVLLFYDEEKKTHTIMPPQQKVTAAGCDYNRGVTIDGLTMIGTIHSHAAMSAFHSGTDDKDEESFDGLHITIGNMRDPEVSISASIVANGYRIMIDPSDYVEQLELTKDIDEKEERATTTIYRYIDGKLVKDDKKTSRYSYTQRKFDKRYVSTVSNHQKRFNKKWMKMVEKGTYAHVYRGAGAAAYGWTPRNQGWGGNYDSWAWGEHQPWRNNKNLPATVINRSIPPQNVGPQKTPGIIFPPHDTDEDDYNACEGCLHRDDKIQWAIEQYTEEVDGPDEDELTNNFVLDDRFDHMFQKGEATSLNIICSKCKLKFNLGLSTVCPGCGEVAPDEIDMKDVEVGPMDPVIGQDFVCPTCGNTFTHKGKDICPFCDEELDFEEHRSKKLMPVSKQSDEEIEVGSGGNLKIGEGYACISCNVVFIAEHEIENCPGCDSVMIDGYNCSQYDDETRRQRTQQADAGEFLHGHGEEFTQATLDAAAADDKTLEQPLPDPKKDSIPLSTRVQKTSKMSLKEMFKTVFGGGE